MAHVMHSAAGSPNRAGAGRGTPRLPGLGPQTPEEVAEAIVDLVITGAESAVLVPDQLRQR
jgi:hypothetical protein